MNDIYGAGTQTWAASDDWTLHKPELYAEETYELFVLRERDHERVNTPTIQGEEFDNHLLKEYV